MSILNTQSHLTIVLLLMKTIQRHFSCYLAGRLDTFGGPKLKIDHLILNAKLSLIKMNYEEFFFFF